VICWNADNVISCPQCKGRSHDAVRDERRKPPWASERSELLVCNFCGLGRWVNNAPPAPFGDEARFQSGRYAGKTIPEVDAMPNGRRYLQAIRDQNKELCEVVSRYLAASQ
jgi:uncharacterized protein YbaR (Trm112 family)